MKSFNKIFILTILTLLSLPLNAKEQEESENDFFANFIVGKYQIIGKSLDSKHAYFGIFEIKKENGELIFIKEIDGKSIHGKAHVKKTMSESTKVLRLSYHYLKQVVEETCLVSSDLDNYPRITCHLYEKDVATTSPGLEAMFIIHEE